MKTQLKNKYLLIAALTLFSFSLEAQPVKECPQVVVDVGNDNPVLHFYGVTADPKLYQYALVTDAEKKHWDKIKIIANGYQANRTSGRIFLITANNDIDSLRPYRFIRGRAALPIPGRIPQELSKDSLGDLPKDTEVCSLEF